MKNPASHPRQAGFTLIELLIVLGIITTLFGLGMVALGKPQTTASLNDAVSTLLADIKSQQQLAMSGGTGSTTSAEPQGIYIQDSRYTLYSGNTFDPGDANNFVIGAPSGITYSTTLSGGKLLFANGTGEVDDFSSGDNTITATATDGSSRTVTLNRLGATSVQ